MNPAFDGLPRNQRRMLLSAEARNRETGQWGAWETLRFPPGSVGSTGWLPQITIAHRNKVFSVLDRDAGNGVRHLAVTSLSQVRPTWWEMQRIKNELAGEAATAIEVYPPQRDVVDEADMFHIWVVPPLTFGLKSK